MSSILIKGLFLWPDYLYGNKLPICGLLPSALVAACGCFAEGVPKHWDIGRDSTEDC